VLAKFTGKDPDGRRFTTSDLRNPGVRANLVYEFKGYKPHPNGWAISRERMEKYEAEARLWFPENPQGRIRLKRYLDEQPGQKVQNLWDDIPPINSLAQESGLDIRHKNRRRCWKESFRRVLKTEISCSIRFVGAVRQ
jgi:site-specific DNA-methyltransferase (adenine-specific)